jgi:hypothetical protein
MLPTKVIPISAGVLALLSMSLHASIVSAQPVLVPLAPERWSATDSLRFETYLDRPSLYINRGVALARDVSLQDGTIEYDMAATKTTSFFGAAFRARALNQSEVVFFRPGASGTPEAVQYGPALNSVATAWQIYHGDDANATVDIARERWTHVRIELAGATATMFFDTATKPTLIVPRLAGAGGTALGVWTGAFGRGAWFSNIRYTTRAPQKAAAAPPPPAGTITDWELSSPISAITFTPARLPDLRTLAWQHVRTEAPGFVLVNRYVEAPAAALPHDSAGNVLVDSVMSGHIVGAKVVYARATIDADRDQLRRLRYGYSDGVVIYVNARPMVSAMNPQGLRDLGVMDTIGDAVYLPLKKGRNEIVFAVTEVGGGWAFWARLDAPPE